MEFHEGYGFHIGLTGLHEGFVWVLRYLGV